MSDFGLIPGAMRGAAAAAEGAATGARAADGSDALDTLALALPGTTTAETLPQLGSAWEEGVAAWCDDVDALAVAIDDLTAAATAADGRASSWLDGLVGALGFRP